MISIVIPVYNEENYISGCISSVLLSGYSVDRMELFIVDGGSTDRTMEIVKSFQKNYSCIKILNNINKTVPYAMNMGIRASKGNYIICLGAHSIYPKNYFCRLVEAAETLKADNVGGVCITDVKNKNPRTLAIREVLSNKFGVGNSLFRVGVDKITEPDTVPFGCYRRDVFERFGYFDERLTRNQDIEFSKRIKRKNGKIYLIPEVKTTYFARESFRELAKSNFLNGFWNILTCYFSGKFNSLSFRHYVPLIFISVLLLPLILMIININFLLINLSILILYFFSISIISINIYIKEKLSIPHVIYSFAVLHFSYGFGSLCGIFKTIITAYKINGNAE
jgi:glycosyltransferase involved in cell wall biosynthesis